MKQKISFTTAQYLITDSPKIYYVEKSERKG